MYAIIVILTLTLFLILILILTLMLVLILIPTLIMMFFWTYCAVCRCAADYARYITCMRSFVTFPVLAMILFDMALFARSRIPMPDPACEGHARKGYARSRFQCRIRHAKGMSGSGI
jgi:hypothetical protein